MKIRISESELVNIVRNTINEIIGGTGKDGPLNRQEILLFKQLNNHKKELGDKNSLMKFIKEFLPILGLPAGQELFYYETYTQNYRPQGDYENITHETFKNVRQLKSKKVSNSRSSEYVTSQIPFVGSNLEGYWDVNHKNQWYYVVKSYGWYPIYLHINNQWYEVSDRYSSSTGRQMGQSRPRYSNYVKDRIISVTQGEMNRLIRGDSLVEIEKDRTDRFVDDSKNFYPNKKLSMIVGQWGNKKRVEILINRIGKYRDKVKFIITILKANRMDGRKTVETPDGKMVDTTILDQIKQDITNRIIGDNSEFLSEANTIFEFKVDSH